MGLIEKLRHYQYKAGIASIAVGSLLLAGCETVPDGYTVHYPGKPTVPYSSSNNKTSSDDYLLGSLIFGGAALNQNLTPQQSAAFSTLGRVAETGAIIQGQKEAAREGKSQVNVSAERPAEKFYIPPGATIELGNGDKLTNIQPGSIKRNPDGTYSARGTLIKHQKEAAREGKSQVNVHTRDQKHPGIYLADSENEQEDFYFRSTPWFINLERRVPNKQSPYLFFFNKFIDLDGDGEMGYDEFFGIKEEFELGKETIEFNYLHKTVKGDNLINIKLWKDSGEFLAESNFSTNLQYRIYGSLYMGNYPGETPSDPLDVMERLTEFGPGKYVITATVNGKQSKRADFRIK